LTAELRNDVIDWLLPLTQQAALPAALNFHPARTVPFAETAHAPPVSGKVLSSFVPPAPGVHFTAWGDHLASDQPAAAIVEPSTEIAPTVPIPRKSPDAGKTSNDAAETAEVTAGISNQREWWDRVVFILLAIC
jgi:hypothetical protein